MIKVTVPDMGIIAHVPHNPASVDNSSVKVVKGDKGAVFTPYVDELSNLSWTNDGGLDNPPTRNIKGSDASVTPLSNMEIEMILED